MSDEDYVANLRKSAGRMALVAMSLEDFAARVVAEALHRPPLTEARILEIRAECIRSLKNSEALGMTIEAEAETFGKAIKHFEEMMDTAITRGREDANR